MSRNRVTGPSSALSSFLRERGITARGSRFERRQDPANTQEAPEQSPQEQQESANQESTQDQQEVVQEQVNEETVPVTIKRKKAIKKKKKESDDEGSNDDIPKKKFKPSKGIDKDGLSVCCRCHSRFVQKASSSLCASCLTLSTVNDIKKGKGKIKPVVETSTFIDGAEDTVLSLEEICLRVLSRFIENVESLGEISDSSRERLAYLLSKHRLLSMTNIRHLFNIKNTRLIFQDCSKIDCDGFRQIAVFNPNLEYLTLGECGQMADETVEYFADRLSNLKELKLSGAFLVRDKAMASMILKLPNLETFSVEYSQRINQETVTALSTLSNLKSLSLRYILNLTPTAVKEVKLNPALEELDLSNCVKLADESIISLLSNLPNLKILRLSGCILLTDSIIEFIGQNLHLLQELDISSLPLITDQGLNSLSSLKLQSMNISRNDNISNIKPFLKMPLQKINLNGLHLINKSSLDEIIAKNLIVVDLSWCKVDDEMLYKILSIDCLSEVCVWGCGRVSDVCVKHCMERCKKRGIKFYGCSYLFKG